MARLNILVVEDDPVWQRTFPRVLALVAKRCGVDIRWNVDGSVKEARARLRWRRYDGWIVDIRLPPGPDGWALVEDARSRRDTTPILVVSGDRATSHPGEAQLADCEFAYKEETAQETARRIRRSSWPEPEDKNGPNVEHFIERLLAARAVDLRPRARAFADARGMEPRMSDLCVEVAKGTARADLPAALGITMNGLKKLAKRTLKAAGVTSLDDLLRLIVREPLEPPPSLSIDPLG